jgi:hypothetical protein
MGGGTGDSGPTLHQSLLIAFRTYCLTSWILMQLHVHRMHHPCQREKAGTQPSCGADGGMTPCPEAKERKAGQEWAWQWLFPKGRRCRIRRRHATPLATHSPLTCRSRASVSAPSRSSTYRIAPGSSCIRSEPVYRDKHLVIGPVSHGHGGKAKVKSTALQWFRAIPAGRLTVVYGKEARLGVVNGNHPISVRHAWNS